MKRGSIRLIILLASFLLIGLTTTQIFWVQKAYEIQEKQVDFTIIQSLKSVAEQILIYNNDSSQLYNPVEQVSPEIFLVRIREQIQPYYLQTLLTNEFQNQEINLDFEYSLYDCFNDSVVFNRKVFLAQTHEDSNQNPDVDWANDAHYFSVFFPNKNTKILGKMNFWVISSILLFVIVLFFAYTISIILKQKKLSEVKTDFINNMTHELKTPISTIGLSSKILMQEKIIEQPERLRNYADIIHTENNRLQKQVEKVLQIATLDKETVDIKQNEIDILKIIENCISGVSMTLQEADGKINFKNEATNTYITGDEVHLTNVFSNLIDNAIKYRADSRPLEINILLQNDSKYLSISIADNGIGISHNDQKMIFDKFFRVPKGDVHNVKGFGLGLHYVKVMTDYHKGKISLHSQLNKGSEFIVKLPIQNSNG